MAACNHLTKSMLDILQSFEDKLEALDATMHPIHMATQALTTRQDNLESTLSSVDSLIKHVELANTPGAEIPLMRKGADYSTCIEFLRDIHRSVGYFVRHKRFRKGDEALSRLREILDEGIRDCLREFTHSVTISKAIDTKAQGKGSTAFKSGASQPYSAAALLGAGRWVSPDDRERGGGGSVVDSTIEDTTFAGSRAGGGGSRHRLGVPLESKGAGSSASRSQAPDDADNDDAAGPLTGEEREREILDMVDEDLVRKLGTILAFLYLNKESEGVLDKLVSERSAYLSSFLSMTIEKRQTNPLRKRNSRRSRDDKAKVGSRYERGTHQAIFLIRLTRELLALEFAFLSQLLKEHGNLPHTLTYEKMGKILEVPIEYLDRRWTKTAKENIIRPLVCLDMLGEYNAIRGAYFQVLESGGQKTSFQDVAQKMHGLLGTVSKACGRAFLEYKQRLEVKIRNEVLDKKTQVDQLPKDGTVWSRSVSVMNFLLVSLQEYKDVLELPMLAKTPEMGSFCRAFRPQTRNMLALIVLALTAALKNTLAQIAKGYKKSSLAQIFLLNNYHFVLKRIKECAPVSAALKGTHFNAEWEKLMEGAKQAYLSHTWDKAMAPISPKDTKQLLARCKPSGKPGDSLLYPDRWAKQAIKSKFKEFNDRFQKEYSQQRGWSVPDADLRNAIRNANIKKVVGEYEAFYEIFKNVEFSHNKRKHMRFTPTVMKEMLELLLPD